MSASLGCLRCGSKDLRQTIGEAGNTVIPIIACRCGAWNLSVLSPSASAEILAERTLQVLDAKDF